MPEFYGTVEDFRAYHSERQNLVDVDVDDNEVRACLLVGSEWMDEQYRAHLSGFKTGEREQIREQPRESQYDAYDYNIPSDVVPREYIHATYEISYRYLIDRNVLHVDYTPTKYDSVSIDGAVSVKFSKFNSVSEIQTNFSKVGAIMSALISGRRATSSLSGSSSRT